MRNNANWWPLVRDSEDDNDNVLKMARTHAIRAKEKL